MQSNSYHNSYSHGNAESYQEVFRVLDQLGMADLKVTFQEHCIQVHCAKLLQFLSLAMPEARNMSQGFFAVISRKICYTIFAATSPNRMAGSLTTICQVLHIAHFLFLLRCVPFFAGGLQFIPGALPWVYFFHPSCQFPKNFKL